MIESRGQEVSKKLLESVLAQTLTGNVHEPWRGGPHSTMGHTSVLDMTDEAIEKNGIELDATDNSFAGDGAGGGDGCGGANPA